MHAFLVSLLIAGILACPYECAAKSAAAARSKSEGVPPVACCEHCHAKAEAAQHQGRAPTDQPVEDENGVDCLCDGAVFDLSRQVVDDEIHSEWNVVTIGDCRALPLPRHDWDAQVVLLSPGGGGMPLRVLLQSFLL